jgi:hypothetical protein
MSLTRVVLSSAAVAGLVTVAIVVVPLCQAAETVQLANSKPSQVAVDPFALSRAQRMVSRLSDLPRVCSTPQPKCWFRLRTVPPGLVNREGVALSCNGHVADFSRLVLKGGWGSRFEFVAEPVRWEIDSGVAIFATPAQAKISLARFAYWDYHYCSAKGMRSGRYVMTSVSRVRVPRLGDEETDVRTLLVAVRGPHARMWWDSVVFRHGAVMGLVEFTGLNKQIPSTIMAAVLKRFAARTGR